MGGLREDTVRALRIAEEGDGDFQTTEPEPNEPSAVGSGPISSGRILVYSFPLPMPELLAILELLEILGAAPPGAVIDTEEAGLLGVALVIRWGNPPPVVPKTEPEAAR